MTRAIRRQRGDYWAEIIPAGRRSWYAMYGHGPIIYSEISSRAMSLKRIEAKVARRLNRWHVRDERLDARAREAAS